MKNIKFFLVFIFLSSWFFSPLISVAQANSLASRLQGRILLQVESYGRAWYVEPDSLERYYLKDRQTAFDIMRNLGLGISNKDLAKIPTKAGEARDNNLVERVKGKILLQVEKNGEAWYVDTQNGWRHYMKDGEAAFQIMRSLGLGISNDNLRQIKMNQEQLVHDTAFDGVAYALYDGDKVLDSHLPDQILAPASLTKLMTAQVMLDLDLDFTEKVLITAEHLDYPRQLVGNDATSEVDLQVGDRVSRDDLWLAMLIASSNQATVALVDSTNIGRQYFVDLMNKKAQELGLEKTVFFEFTGLDSHNVTTASDMVKLAWAAWQKQKIKAVGSGQNITITAYSPSGDKRSIGVADRNYSLQSFGAEVAKTGFLVEAQRTVVLQKNGIIIAILHARSMAERNSIIRKLLSS